MPPAELHLFAEHPDRRLLADGSQSCSSASVTPLPFLAALSPYRPLSDPFLRRTDPFRPVLGRLPLLHSQAPTDCPGKYVRQTNPRSKIPRDERERILERLFLISKKTKPPLFFSYCPKKVACLFRSS